jgi:hypothetical protein
MSYWIDDVGHGVYESLRFVGDDGSEHPVEVWPAPPRYRFREVPYRDSKSYGSDDLEKLLVIYEKWRVSSMGGER